FLSSWLLSFFVAILFFFSSRRRHTISKRDWSSDVCSSDLCRTCPPTPPPWGCPPRWCGWATSSAAPPTTWTSRPCRILPTSAFQIGRASCREREYITVGAGSCNIRRYGLSETYGEK